MLHSRLLPYPIPPLLFPPSLAGGFKLWEGSVDLCKSLCEVFKLDAELLSSGQTTGLLEVREGGGGSRAGGGARGRQRGYRYWRCVRVGIVGRGGCQGGAASFSNPPIPPTLISAHLPALPSRSPQGKKVLELGCGHGLPGILCLMAGADVHFQV